MKQGSVRDSASCFLFLIWNKKIMYEAKKTYPIFH